MVVWTYDLDSIIPTCRDFEEKLIKLVSAWTRRSAFASLASSAAPSTFDSDEHLTEKAKPGGFSEKPSAIVRAPKEVKTPPKKRSCDIFGYWKAEASDLEKTAEGPSARPMRMFAPVYCGLGAALSICEPSVSFHLWCGYAHATISLHRERCQCAARRIPPGRELGPLRTSGHRPIPVLCLIGAFISASGSARDCRSPMSPWACADGGSSVSSSSSP